jgi:hypothetical protein
MLKSISFFLLLYLSLTHSSFAHNVKNDNGVGNTFHIEPKHNPRAGEPSLAWFALTSKGGKLIPLQDCDCQLKVTLEKDGKEKTIATPNLKPISTEQYQNIPSATINFPQAGIYDISISGKPKSGNGFFPFELSYEVIVSSNNPQSSTSQTKQIRQHEQFTDATVVTTDTIPETNDSGLGFSRTLGVLAVITTIYSLIFITSNKQKK